jgi:hypothetical protein
MDDHCIPKNILNEEIYYRKKTRMTTKTPVNNCGGEAW